MNLYVLPEAHGDMSEALIWLVGKRRYGAIRTLWQGWQTGLDAIIANPRMYSLAEDAPAGVEVRNYLLPRSQYRIVYLVRSSDLVVIALTRGRRQQELWLSRLPQVISP